MKNRDIDIDVLGMNFSSDDERVKYFREDLKKKIADMKSVDGFPCGSDDDIINLSNPPFYTACPNPYVNNFIDKWEEEKKELEKEGKRSACFKVNEPYVSSISEGKNNKFYRLHTYHTKVPHPAIMKYLLYYTQPGDIIYDGFSGTGMTGVAASKCGSCSDDLKKELRDEFIHLNRKEPVWGARKSILSDLSPAATFISANLNSKYETKEIKDSIYKKTNNLYNNIGWMFETRHIDGGTGVIDYVVWGEVVQCPFCNIEFTLWSVCADIKKGRMSKEFNCPSCDSRLSKKSSNKVFETKFDSILKKPIRVVKYEPLFIKYSIRGKSFYKKPDSVDIDNINKIEGVEIKSHIPLVKLAKGSDSNRCKRIGITHVHHFYTKRNLIFISELWSQFDIQERFVATSIMSRNLTKLNRFVINKHNPRGRINGPLSGTLYVPSEYVEQNPFDLLKSKIPKFSWDNSDSVISTHAAQSSLINDNTIDYIFTDPPFGANIMYSELNIIWESWLGVFTDNASEAIESKHQDKSIVEYERLMLDCFKEYFRILKPGKWMTVVFSNTRAEVWNSIQNSIRESGFIIAGVSSLDKKHGGIKSMTYQTSVKQDLVMSCYKPSSVLNDCFSNKTVKDISVWEFIDNHLNYLPVELIQGRSSTDIIERSPKILFDRVVAFYVCNGLQVPLDATDFQKGLRSRFIEIDGMFFTKEQSYRYLDLLRNVSSDT